MTRCFLFVAVLAAVALASGWSFAQEGKAKSGAKGAAEPAEGAGAEAAAPAEGAEGKAAEPGEGGHGHDETDLSEGNASSAMTRAEDLRFDLSIYTFVVFMLLLAILYKFAWGPISRGLGLREETIARQIEEARLASEKAAHQLQEYEARLAAATEEARHIVGQSRKDAETAKDKIMAEARELAQKERERAVADITSAKNQALAEIAQKSVETAVSLAGRIIRREVKPQDHEALIGEALGQFTKLN
jgi:F-type H+-transporting ATPase subunit b